MGGAGQQRLTSVIRRRWENRGAAEGSAGRNRYSPRLLISGPHCRQNSLGRSAESGVKECLRLVEVKDLKTDKYSQ